MLRSTFQGKSGGINPSRQLRSLSDRLWIKPKQNDSSADSVLTNFKPAYTQQFDPAHTLGCGCFQHKSAIQPTIGQSTPRPAATSSLPYYIEALLPPGQLSWSPTLGQGVTVTFSFMTAVPSYYGPGKEERNNFIPFSANQVEAAKRALAIFSRMTNLQFIQVDDAGSGGQIRFGTAALGDKTNAWAYFPSSSPTGGDVWLNNQNDVNSKQNDGESGFLTLIHELGHALGLKHPGNYNGSNGSTPGPYLPTGEDNFKYTTMSYNSHPGSGVFASTPLLYDIAALQYLYGANTSTRRRDDTYFWMPGKAFVATIWDGDGRDTINAGNQTMAVSINLNPGSFSSIGPGIDGSNVRATDNLAIAFNVNIENAVGGMGDDVLTGNSLGNRLYANNGNDYLGGGAGNDTLTGGAGTDRFVFEAGGQVFSAAAVGFDQIMDFDVLSDRLVFSRTTFNAGTTFARVATDALAAVSNASIAYSLATGGLFYNPNGAAAGFGTGGQFAQLTASLALESVHLEWVA
jgi:Ca2+-binding RTX toxin-like protein